MIFHRLERGERVLVVKKDHRLLTSPDVHSAGTLRCNWMHFEPHTLVLTVGKSGDNRLRLLVVDGRLYYAYTMDVVAHCAEL